jgi:hypothetical protein
MGKRVNFVTSAVSALCLGGVLATASGGTAVADTTISGPINLGTAAPFGVLAASAVTNTGATTITGDVGISPLTSVVGFPPGMYTGSLEVANGVSLQAQIDMKTAYDVAASLTPTTAGLADLTSLGSLVPGVYSGGALSLNGPLTLAGTGSPNDVWVFQAASALLIDSAAQILYSGGASSCNVFWQVGSSATINTGADFGGTVLADQSISVLTGASIEGRLLAHVAAVTLQTNDIVVPSGCAASGTVSSSPVVTSGSPPEATLDAPYSFTIVATGSPAPDFTVTSGALPAGLTLGPVTGEIAGTPVAVGDSPFTVTVSNGVLPDAVVAYSITVSASPTLAPTGAQGPAAFATAGAVLVLGLLLVVRMRRHA